MFCGAALTFPGSGDGLLVVAMFRMVIALVAGVGLIRACLRPADLPKKTENVKITHENIPENVKS